MRTSVLVLFTSIILQSGVSAQSLTKIWSTSDGLKTPESVLYDAATNSIYVSNINGNHSEKDGNGFISVLDASGKMKKLEWVSGLNAPKGLAIYSGNLYVADIDELVVISIADAKIVKRHHLPNAKFLNDVTAADDGTIFVTDMNENKIYALNDGKLSLWFEDQSMKRPNGLWTEKGQLYIGTDQILQVNIKNKTKKVLVENCGGIDGLEALADGNFIYSNWPGRIFVTKGPESVKLIDTVDKLNTADIDFVPGKNLVLVPTFLGNSVDAYQLK